MASARCRTDRGHRARRGLRRTGARSARGTSAAGSTRRATASREDRSRRTSTGKFAQQHLRELAVASAELADARARLVGDQPAEQRRVRVFEEDVFLSHEDAVYHGADRIAVSQLAKRGERSLTPPVALPSRELAREDDALQVPAAGARARPAIDECGVDPEVARRDAEVREEGVCFGEIVGVQGASQRRVSVVEQTLPQHAGRERRNSKR